MRERKVTEKYENKSLYKDKTQDLFLIESNLKGNMMSLKELNEQFDSLYSSQLSIVIFITSQIANSPIVKILCLTDASISILSEELQTELHGHLTSDLFLDIDRPYKSILDLESKVRRQQDWEKYKHQLRKLKLSNQ